MCTSVTVHQPVHVHVHLHYVSVLLYIIIAWDRSVVASLCRVLSCQVAMIDGLRRKVRRQKEGEGGRKGGREILIEVYGYLNRARGYELHNNCMIWKIVMSKLQLYHA